MAQEEILMPRHTTERQDMILSFLRSNGPSTVAEISEVFSTDYRVINPDIMRMEGRSIRRAGWSGTGRNGRRLWEAI